MSSNPFHFNIPESLKANRLGNLTTSNATRDRLRFSFKRKVPDYNASNHPDERKASSTSRLTNPFRRSATATRSETSSKVARGMRRSSTIRGRASEKLPTLQSTLNQKLRNDATPLKSHKIVSSGTARNARFTSKIKRNDIEIDDIFSASVSPIERKPAQTGPVGKTCISKSEIERQLRGLIGRICESDYDKYLVLDERDKIMQKGRIKSADVENATVIQGTCPDMCPEKERYVRIVQNRLTSYECSRSGKIAPELTVKEYSRSAADQDEPLPHELRPSHVLLNTMNYLSEKIANSVPENEDELAQWYDFLWSRTRAIRKDITQQMMVNDVAVSLIERCVRFHVFASHRLCQLGLNEFDQKMNTENLSKSLQSLRHLYDDLGKKGVFYETESEFRSYEIMLNLEDSNVFRHALTFRREVLDSTSVRLALRLFTCLQNNNYVKFFRLLINEATYLQCCLCHRYFNYLRDRAIYTISHSANISGKYPVMKFAFLLGFDDRELATEFTDVYGIRRMNEIDTDEEYLLISKARLTAPLEDFPTKIHSWIEQKRNGYSVSEILSGGENVTAEVHSVVNSFDANGAYVNDSVVKEYINQIEKVVSLNEIAQPTKISEDQTFKDHLVAPTSSLLDELIEQEITKVCKLILEKTILHSLTTQLFDAFLQDSIRSLCQKSIFSLDLLHKKEMEAVAVKQRCQEIRSLQADFFNDLTENVIFKVVNAFLREHRKQFHQKLMREHAVTLNEEILKETVDILLRRIGRDEIQKDALEFKQRIQRIVQRLEMLWLKQFFDHWRKKIALKKAEERKKIDFLNSFPVTLSANLGIRSFHRTPVMQTVNDKIDSLSSEQNVDLLLMRRGQRLAKRYFIKWKHFCEFQIEKKKYFNMLVPVLPEQKKIIRRSALSNEMESRMILALADKEEAEFRRDQNLLLSYAPLQESSSAKTWKDSLIQRSSPLLDYFDASALQEGLDQAKRNMPIVRKDPCRSFDNFKNQQILSTKSSSFDVSRGRGSEKNFLSGTGPPVKRKCDGLEEIAQRLNALTAELDKVVGEAEQNNRKYAEINNDNSIY